VRIIRTRLPEAATELLDSSQAGLDAVQVWTLRQVAIQQLRAKGPVDPLTIAAAHRVPMALIRPAIDDAVQHDLVAELGGRVERSKEGGEGFPALVGELWQWLIREVEEANGEPLDDA